MHWIDEQSSCLILFLIKTA